MKIEKIHEKPVFVKMLVYGSVGVGKTVFSSTAPKPLLIDAEAGTLSIRSSGIDIVVLSDFAELTEIFEYVKHKKHGYQTIIIDSLTEMMKKSMDKIMRDVVVKDSNRDAEVPALRDWGKNIEQIRKVVRAFRDLPMHVIFTTLVREDKDEAEGSITFKPALAGKLALEVPGYVDVVGYMFVQTMNENKSMRRMLVQPHSKYTAKDRTGKLGQVIDEPTFPKILEMITRGGEKNGT